MLVLLQQPRNTKTTRTAEKWQMKKKKRNIND